MIVDRAAHRARHGRPALFPVSWAGETVSNNRLDTAREYTELWHHQMQIRCALDAPGLAVGAPDVLLAPAYLMPLLDTAVRVLPHAYGAAEATEGTTIVLELNDGSWMRTLRRERARWSLYEGADDAASARVTASADAFWRHFFNALGREQARQAVRSAGGEELLVPFWRARSVMV